MSTPKRAEANGAHVEFSFEGSEVRRVQHVEDGSLRIDFSAASVRRTEADGHGSSDGHLQGLQLRLQAARWQGELGDALGGLDGATLSVAGRALRRLPLPCAAFGACHMDLRFANGSTLSIAAASGELELLPGWHFAEAMNC